MEQNYLGISTLMKRTHLLCVVGAVLIAYGCADPSSRTVKFRPSDLEGVQKNCQKQLRSLAYCVFAYRHDHNEKFPKDLEEAVSIEAGQAAQRLMVCPAPGASLRYAYVDWSRWFTNANIPTNYPLLYEVETGLHGVGVNIVLMNGQTFWDADRRWMQDFVRAHPQFELALPR